MYDIKALDIKFAAILKCNPLYQFINFARTIILYHQCPTPFQFLACLASALVFLLLGVVVFRKNQDKFIYYI